MKWKTMAALVLGAAATLAGAEIANAQDFNFTIPVRVNAWPREVPQGEVWCWVGPADMPLAAMGGGLGPDASGKVIGRGRTRFPVDGNSGSFSGNIAVRFSADPGKNPGDATKYWCALGIPVSDNHVRYVTEVVQLRPGAPFTWSVSGSLIPLPVREAPAREMQKK